MKSIFVVCFLAVAPVLAAVSGCVSPTEEEIFSADESELRTLTPAEILGTIAYGETKSFAYTETPRYRAYTFTASAGDHVAVDVHAVRGHPLPGGR